MNNIILLHTVVVLIIWALVSLSFINTYFPKFLKKIIKKRKKYFLILAVLMIIFVWMKLEEVLSSFTSYILIIIQAVLFYGVLVWTIITSIKEKKRITQAEKRRKEREKK